MPNLPVPVLAQEIPGNYWTAALYTNNVYNSGTFLLTPPLFAGFQSAAQSVPNSTNTPILIDTTTQDTYGAHSNVTNSSRYTAQVAGWYWVYGTVAFVTNSSGFRSLSITKNGSTVNGAFAVAVPSSSYLGSCQVSAFVFLNVGDYAEVYAYQTSGGALNTSTGSGQTSSMSCWWVHA